MTAALERKASRPYGLWDSPISPLLLAQGLRLGDSAWDTDGRTLVWLEGRSDRGVLVCATEGEPAPRDLTSDLSVRAMVGYGGGDFTVGHGAVYFIADGRIYRQQLAGGPARSITPAFGAAAAPALSPDGRWLLYVSSYEGEDCLAVVDSAGRGWPVKLAQGHDFFMQPRWSPDGTRIAWIAWDHPNMPWDGTELWVAEFDAADGLPRLRAPRRLAGGRDIAVYQPEFTPDGRALLYVSDESGWGQLYLQPLDDGSPRRLTDGSGEYGEPAWQQGQHTYTLVDGGIVCVRAEQGFHRLQHIDLQSGHVRDIGGDTARYTTFAYPSGCGRRVAVTAGAPDLPPRLILVNVHDGAVTVRARSMGETVPTVAYARPEPLSWSTTDGDVAYGLFYPPHSTRFQSRGLPPLVVLVHGGPTSQVLAGFQPQAQFFATRGYAVLQVNYRGSTGYGRAYMLKLRGNWGVHDVEDCRTGALYLAETGRVDPRRRVIMGGSAGGFTVLQSLVTYPGFYTAAVCLYGVSNQFTLAAETHKFESRYLDSLLGPLPEAAEVYRARSPQFHAARIQDPIALFQGTEDKVVPRAQSDAIVASLRARGVPHESHVYEGEGHGWRKTETIEHFYTAVERFLRQYVVFS